MNHNPPQSSRHNPKLTNSTLFIGGGKAEGSATSFPSAFLSWGKLIFQSICIGVVISTVLTFAITFFYAYFGDFYTLEIPVNNYGEAHWEAVGILFTVFVALPYIVVTVVKNW